MKAISPGPVVDKRRRVSQSCLDIGVESRAIHEGRDAVTDELVLSIAQAPCRNYGNHLLERVSVCESELALIVGCRGDGLRPCGAPIEELYDSLDPMSSLGTYDNTESSLTKRSNYLRVSVASWRPSIGVSEL